MLNSSDSLRVSSLYCCLSIKKKKKSLLSIDGMYERKLCIRHRDHTHILLGRVMIHMKSHIPFHEE